MFKKKCSNCKGKISAKYNFCPYCRMPLQKNQDFGMLGRNDFQEKQNNIQDPFLNGLGGNMLGKMLGSAMKMLEKEIGKEMSKPNQQPKTNIKLMINGKEINMNNPEKPMKKEKTKITEIKLPNKKLNISKLPKKEPATNIRRLSDKVIYEVKMPGVKSIKDISMIKLENSIEIKAIAKNKAYVKLIQINLPIIHYEFDKGTLILELEAKN
jgi:hypothetical protein